jgi:hypothetical protein
MATPDNVSLEQKLPPQLDLSLYSLVEKVNLQFFKEQTRIKDDEELREHIFEVQRKAYEV